jgi:hypothetical protein
VDCYQAATEAFKGVYPEASAEMIATAVHHIYTDGTDAALDFIAGAEMFLRDPNEDWLSHQYDLLYHLYNWHMFLSLLPEGTQDVLDALDDLKESVKKERDPKEILDAITELRDMLMGHRGQPDFRA